MDDPFPNLRIVTVLWKRAYLALNIKFPVEVKISNAVVHCQNSFYFSISTFSMSPTFRRAVRVQKCLFVPEHGDLKELLKLRTNARLFTKLFIANYVETITCATNGKFCNSMFNV